MLVLSGACRALACPSRRGRLPALLVLAAALLLLGPGGAAALIVYGQPRAVPGRRRLSARPARRAGYTDQVCPGAAAGLAGAQAVAVSPDGASVYVAGEGAVVALARDRATGALRSALSPSTARVHRLQREQPVRHEGRGAERRRCAGRQP